MYCISYNLYKYIQRLSPPQQKQKEKKKEKVKKGSWGFPVTQVQGEERREIKGEGVRKVFL